MPVSFQKADWEQEFVTYMPPYSLEEEGTEKRAASQQVVSLCQENGIKLVFLCPPNFRVPTKGFVARMRDVAGYDVPALYYDTT